MPMPDPAHRNLLIHQGSTWTDEIIYKLDGVPADFSGCAARMQVRRSKTAATCELSLTHQSGIELLDNGRLRCMLSAAQTAALPTAVLVYDLEIVWSDGTVWRVTEGRITVIQEVTR